MTHTDLISQAIKRAVDQGLIRSVRVSMEGKSLTTITAELYWPSDLPMSEPVDALAGVVRAIKIPGGGNVEA